VKIFITGIRGFLGANLAVELRGRGHLIVDEAPMRLGKPFDPAVFAGADVIIHCAHDFAVGAMAKNIAGTRAWFEAGVKLGVPRQIYLSSYSAREDAASEYGRTKYALERLFLDAGQTVLRPGLVIGNGGLFAKQRLALLRTPIVPLIGGGTQPTAVIAIGHFTAATTAIIEAGRSGAFNLFYEAQPSAREFVRAVKTAAGQRAHFLPISIGLAIGLAGVVQLLRLPVPVQSDQIRALAANASAPWRSSLAELLPDRQREFSLEYALGAVRFT
jgi:nucleoside-diphosphate-sugar epimerase